MAKIMSLVEDLIKEKWLKTPRIIEAFKKIKRADFLPLNVKDLAESNSPLPIGFSQTISQSLVVAFMLEQLEPKAGEKIMDIGSGSGWTSALLAEIVGPKGQVIAIEIIQELAEFGKRNAAKYGLPVQFICADGSKGYRDEAPYDKILASASGKDIPLAWKKQLKVGGIIVAPAGNSIWRIVKESESRFEETEYPGFVFVPLIVKP